MHAKPSQYNEITISAANRRKLAELLDGLRQSITANRRIRLDGLGFDTTDETVAWLSGMRQTMLAGLPPETEPPDVPRSRNSG